MKKEEKENLEGEFTVTSECLKEVKFKVRKLKIQDVKAGTVFKLVKTKDKKDWDEDSFKYVRTINYVEKHGGFVSGRVVNVVTTFGSSYIGESDLDYDCFVNMWVGQVCGFPSIEEKPTDFSNLNKTVTPLNDDFPIEKEPVPTFSLTDVFIKKYKTETWTIDINLITDKEVIAVISSKIKDKYIIPPSTVSYTVKAFEDIIKNYEKHS